MPVTGSHVLSHGAPLLFPHHSMSACSRPPLRLTPHIRTASYATSSGAALLSSSVCSSELPDSSSSSDCSF
eukprot:1896105-Prymnesium_polylepis.1